MKIKLRLSLEEKIAPESSPVTAFSPYFSWTSLYQPVIELEQRKGSVTPSEWQQIYTKNDFEESNSSVPIFHLGSFHLLNGRYGSEGTVTLKQKRNGQLINAWDYIILGTTKFENNIFVSKLILILTCICMQIKKRSRLLDYHTVQANKMSSLVFQPPVQNPISRLKI